LNFMESSTALSRTSSTGVQEEESREVALIIQGYEGPQAYADSASTEIITRQNVTPNAYINWRRIAVPELFLTATAHLLFIQGISPSQFFLASGLIVGLGKKQKAYPGPLMYLSGVISPPYEVPAKFSKLVLGQLLKSSSDKIGVGDTFLALAKYESQKGSRKGA
jgi:hypothetical protein